MQMTGRQGKIWSNILNLPPNAHQMSQVWGRREFGISHGEL